MTKSTITRERLAKIKSWRETYGAGSNVMLPAEEAEKLALIALAAMGSETAIADCDPEVYEKGVSVCLVAIPKETAEVICQNITAATGCKVDWHYFGGRVHIKALRVASQPAPVVNYVPLGGSPYDVPYSMPSNLREFIDQEIGVLFSDDDAQGVWIACRRAAMLQAKSLYSINPAPDLVSLQKKAESIIGNYPGIPDGSENCPCCGKKLRRACSVEGCGGKHVAHGLCQKHYDMKRWEDPEQVERFREADRRYRGKKKTTVTTPQEPKP